jgi:hypothetical protein
MADVKKLQAKTFYLNEQHELARSEKEGAGRAPQYVPVDWTSRGARISASLKNVKKELDASTDPIRQNHYFVLANPVESIAKISKDRKKAPHGTLT